MSLIDNAKYEQERASKAAKFDALQEQEKQRILASIAARAATAEEGLAAVTAQRDVVKTALGRVLGIPDILPQGIRG